MHSPVAQGLFRDSEGWARVRFFGGNELDVPKEIYEEVRHEPSFDQLPLVEYQVKRGRLSTPVRKRAA